jgi:hypothetical protein
MTCVGLRDFANWLTTPDPSARVEAGSPGVVRVDSPGVISVDSATWGHLLTLAGVDASAIPSSVSRIDALKVPALANGVNVLKAIAQKLPLVADPSPIPTSFLSELDPDYPVGWTIAKTVEDLIFYPVAYWYTTSRDSYGFPRTIQRVDPQKVRIDAMAGRIWINDVEVKPSDVIRFSGITDGLLVTGTESIATALANIRAARRVAEYPMPGVYWTDADGMEPLEPAEAQQYLQAFKDAVTNRGTAYMAGLKPNTFGWDPAQVQLVEARQQDAVAMAQLLAMPVRYLAAPSQGDSLTYSNLTDVRRDLVEVGGLAQYMVPIEQRLSMPDVTPRGTTVRFDPDSFFLQITPDQPNPQDVTVPALPAGAPA